MIPDKCPKCGADKDHGRSTIFNRFYKCGSLLMDAGVDQEPECIERERDQLAARVKRLEEVGDYWIPRDSDAQEAWAKAKGAKP